MEEISNTKSKTYNGLFIFSAVFLIILTIAFIIFVLLILFVKTNKGQTFGLNPLEQPLDDINQEFENLKIRFENNDYVTKPTIFVAIASYRDPELVVTINDLYLKAFNKNRIFIGIVEQNDGTFDNPGEDDPNCYAFNSGMPQSQMRVMFMHYSQAKGPTYARSLCEQLFENQDYYLLSDSHIRFEAGWDCELIDNILRCPRPAKTVLTMYPEGYDRRIDPKTKEITYHVQHRKIERRERFKYFNQDGIAEHESLNTFLPPSDVPNYCPFFGACFAFGHSSWMKEVPYHNDTPHLFFGEEILMSVRLLSHGYDLRAPRYSVLYHNWNRDYRKKYFSHEIAQQRIESVEKVKNIISGIETESPYSIGKKRSIEEIWDYFGLNPEKAHTPEETTRQREPWILPPNFRELKDEYLNEEFQQKYISDYKKIIENYKKRPKELFKEKVLSKLRQIFPAI